MSEGKKPILVYVTDEERRELEAAAARDDRALSPFCRRLLLEAVRR